MMDDRQGWSAVQDRGTGKCGCGPAAGPRAGMGAPRAQAPTAKTATLPSDVVTVPGGRAEVGTDRPLLPLDGEGPRRFVAVKSFGMDAGAVINERFAAFVADTAHVTDAERFGWSFVFHQHVKRNPDDFQRVVGAEWWLRVEGATWRHPEGPDSDISHRADHPVVHVSHHDAVAFAVWSGGRLPSEAEWEHAARGGLRGSTFPWGDAEPTDEGPYPCNIWQGVFPHRNSEADGFAGTAPARSFEPNGYGLYNMCGNVWEWSADPFRIRSLKRSAHHLNEIAAAEKRFVQKGGSFLCHRSYCFRYRIAARVGNSPDTSSSHTSFRLVYDRPT